LREHRHLGLDLDVARVGAPRPARVLVGALVDDLRPELLGGAAVGIGQEPILGMRALDQEPARPTLPDQVLGERVGLHRP
jgi:hypothetical protein